jgi:hypothetical protein
MLVVLMVVSHLRPQNCTTTPSRCLCSNLPVANCTAANPTTTATTNCVDNSSGDDHNDVDIRDNGIDNCSDHDCDDSDDDVDVRDCYCRDNCDDNCASIVTATTERPQLLSRLDHQHGRLDFHTPRTTRR